MQNRTNNFESQTDSKAGSTEMVVQMDNFESLTDSKTGSWKPANPTKFRRCSNARPGEDEEEEEREIPDCWDDPFKVLALCGLAARAVPDHVRDTVPPKIIKLIDMEKLAKF